MASIIIAGRRFDGQVHESELLIDGDLRPHAGVAGVLGRTFVPGVVAGLVLQWNRVENPKALAGLHVEAAHVAFVIAHALRRHSFAKRRTDDDRVLGYNGRRLKADLAGRQIRKDGLIVVELQVHHTALAERGYDLAVLRFETNQTVPRRYIENPLLLAVGPIGEASTGKLARSRGAALSFMLAVNPQQFAGRGIERNRGAAGSGRGVDDAVHHQRRPFQLELLAVADAIRLEGPRDFELVEIRRVDLIERTVSGAREVRRIARPFAILINARLRGGAQRGQRDHRRHSKHTWFSPVLQRSLPAVAAQNRQDENYLLPEPRPQGAIRTTIRPSS